MGKTKDRAGEESSRYVAEVVGTRLKVLRTGRGMTLNRLAALSGVPASTISKIENRQLRPSLVNAIKLAKALDENLGFLVERYRNRPESVVVVRKGERNTIEFPDMNFTLQDLSGNFFPGALEARIGVLGTEAQSGDEPMTHKGEELCFVLSGTVRYQIGDQSLELPAGEYVQFKSELAHSWQNSHAGESTVLWVFSDNLSF